jgi:hypothetical protein
VAAGARADGDDAIDSLRRRLFRVTQIDHVMKHDAAVAMHRGDDFGGRAQAGDDDGNFVFHTQPNILFQAIVAAVHDLIDRKGRYFTLRVGALKCREFFGYFRQPIVELRGGPCIQSRKGTDDAGLALRQDQSGSGNDEHRSADDG